MEVHRVTPAAYISLARDIIVLALVGFLVYLLISFGENRVEKKDLKALEQRIVDNAATQKRWRDEDTHANTQRDASLAQLHADVNAHSKPVIVRVPAPQAPGLPSTAGEATSAHPECGGAGSGSGGPWRQIDIRPDLTALKLKYGAALIDCKAVLDKWPQ